MKKKMLFLGILSFTLVFSLLFTACPNGDDSPPPAPAAPVVKAGAGQLTISWVAVTGATAYEVWYGTTDTSASAAKYGADVTSLSTTVSGLDSSTTYYVWIKAKNSGGTSGFSPPASGSTLEPQPLVMSDQQVYLPYIDEDSLIPFPVFKESEVSTTITVAELGVTGPITKGKFSLTVPVPPENLLQKADELPNDLSGITMNPTDAKGYGLALTLDDGGSLNLGYMEMGTFTMTGIPLNVGMASYVYVDREVTVDGEATIPVEGVEIEVKVKADNAKLTKGWNVMLIDMTITMSLTGTPTVTSASGTITVAEKPSSKFKWVYSEATETETDDAENMPTTDSRQLLPQFNLLF